MLVYRIAKTQYINDLSGFGAANYPGRWNSKGTYILYTAGTPSLALLESVAHITSLVQVDYSMAVIEIPDDKIDLITAGELPANWSAWPSPEELKVYGDGLVANREFLALKVPSALMAEDFNYLINPAHPDFNKVKIKSSRHLDIDGRLLKNLI